MTFADFAATEIRFRKHFRVAPPETWNDKMVPLAEFLELAEEEREGQFPYIWSVDREQQLMRLLVAQPIVRSCEDRRDFWKMLRAIARVGEKQLDRSRDRSGRATRDDQPHRRRDHAIGHRRRLAPRLPSAELRRQWRRLDDRRASCRGLTATEHPPVGDYMAPWIDTPQCTSCDECVRLNPKIFVYNDQKKAIIKNPQGGPYKDLVKAAERCTAQVIHPGLPKDRSEKDIDKWIARAEKYNQ